MTDSSRPTSNAPAVPRCVLLVGESGAVPSSLVGALDRRGLEITIVRQPPQVMVELAPAAEPSPPTADHVSAHHAADPPNAGRPDPAAASAASAAPDPGLSLVVVEPQQQPRLDELRDALAAYYPAVRCWQYRARDPEGQPSLEALRGAASETASGAATATATARNTPAPPNPAESTAHPQDFVDTRDSNPHTSSSDSADPRDTARVKGSSQRLRSLVVKIDEPRPYDDGPLVSEEELAMLLGPDPQPLSERSTSSSDPADASVKLGISPDSRHPDGERE